MTLVRQGHVVEGSDFQAFNTVAPLWRFWEADAYGNKGVLRVDVTVAGGVAISTLNTHLQAEYGKTRYADVRRAQLQQLRHVAEALEPGRLVLAGGDLNPLPDEPVFGEVTGFWRDLTARMRMECRCGTRFLSDGREEGWIDYVLSRSSPTLALELVDARRVINSAADEPYSDHQALVLRLEVARSGSVLSNGDGRFFRARFREVNPIK